jgi:hypothetical protein
LIQIGCANTAKIAVALHDELRRVPKTEEIDQVDKPPMQPHVSNIPNPYLIMPYYLQPLY